MLFLKNNIDRYMVAKIENKNDLLIVFKFFNSFVRLNFYQMAARLPVLSIS